MITEGIEPELGLLFASAHASINQEQREHIVTLLHTQIDWGRVLEWAMRHHLAPLLFKTLSEHALDELPTTAFGALKLEFEKNRKQALFQVAELIRLVDALRTEGITAIPFKGPALAHYLYSSAAHRVAGDLDFLLRAGDLDRALGVLARCGYTIGSTFSVNQERIFRQIAGQYQIVRADGRVIIEPHWEIGHRVFSFDIEYEGLWSRAVSFDVDGYSVQFLSPHDQIILLCTHGCKEHWIRLKWVSDVAEFLARNPELNWDLTLTRASEWGCRRMLLLGVSLAKELLGASPPPILLEEVAADRVVPDLLRSAIRGIIDLERGTPDIWKINAFRRRMRERPLDQLRYVLRTVFTPKPHHLHMISLPRHLSFGYYAVRCVHDYVGLPVWRMGKLIAGERETSG